MASHDPDLVAYQVGSVSCPGLWSFHGTFDILCDGLQFLLCFKGLLPVPLFSLVRFSLVEDVSGALPDGRVGEASENHYALIRDGRGSVLEALREAATALLLLPDA